MAFQPGVLDGDRDGPDLIIRCRPYANLVSAAAACAVALLAPQQQLALALEDAELVQHARGSGDGWRGYCTINHKPPGANERLREIVLPVAELPWFIEKALRAFRGEDLYIAQHSYAARQRRTGDLLSLNLAHVDLDVYKSAWSKMPAEEVAPIIVARLVDAGIPAPSYIVASGRGLQAKWVSSRQLVHEALPRWQDAHRWLVREDGPLGEFGADEKAILPTQILRLVGSTHQQADEVVRVVWMSGTLTAPTTYDFDAWCSKVLPYSREQVREFRARLQQFKVWDEENAANRQRLAEEEGAAVAKARAAARQKAWEQTARAIGTTPAALASMDDLVAGEVWQRRIKTMEKIVETRWGAAGVPAGQRHEWVWIAANALAWVNRDQAKPLGADLTAWARRLVPGYTAVEVRAAAASVLKRAAGQGAGLYRMTEATFRAKLGVTEEDVAQAMGGRRNADEDRWDIGSMGFERMRGLDFDAYKAETRRRQAEAAVRTNTMHRAAREPLVAKAKALRAAGQSLPEIAKALGVSVGTAWNWTKA